MTPSLSSESVETELPLTGIDGGNPVGFLAALGVLATLARSDRSQSLRLAWQESAGIWNPVVTCRFADVRELAESLAQILHCPFSSDPVTDARREERQKVFDSKKKELKDAQAALKAKKLRGKERDTEYAKTVAPIATELSVCRDHWLKALKACVPSMELSLGKHLNAEQDELRHTLKESLADTAIDDRHVADLLTSFGSDICLAKKSERMEASPFCFVTGSGHQYFLDTARQLTEQVTAHRIASALTDCVPPSDEKLSMRWDPSEDRRYALMWSDPTASGNKTLTNWAINLLAYQGMQLLPSMPTTRGLESTGWARGKNLNWTWPIWSPAIQVDLIRTLLQHSQTTLTKPGTGVQAIFRTFRLQVGNPPLHKINFSPAERIF